MPRLYHGSALFNEELNSFVENMHVINPSGNATFAACPEPTRFGYMFPELQNGDNRLQENDKTVAALIELGLTMRDPAPTDPGFDSTIPSAYTYFGQFIVHDLTFDPITKGTLLTKDLLPLSPAIINALKNPRTGLLDLDSVYGPTLDEDKCYEVPRDGEAMAVARAYGSQLDGTDLPRDQYPPYAARIGDRRNDENLITSQLHLAFLRAHNLVVKAGATFERARALVRQRYQHLVINDFLRKIVADEDIQRVKKEMNTFSPDEDEFFIPIEFSAAAFRFGHSMIRSEYHFNASRDKARLYQLFMPKALGGYFQILEDWIIDWRNFLPGGKNRARAFLPQLVEPLSELLDNQGNPTFSLAVRDLLRGYLLGLPTAQAVAQALGLDSLTEKEIEKSAISDAQRKILHDSGFSQQTPLWFYVFAEASCHHQGARLGPVCGQLVAAVLLGLAKRSHFDDNEEWDPILGDKKDFDLAQLLVHTIA